MIDRHMKTMNNIKKREEKMTDKHKQLKNNKKERENNNK